MLTKYKTQIKILKDEIEEKKKEIKTLEQEEQLMISGLTEICPTCNGEKIEQYIHKTSNGDTRECQTCRGYGRIGPIKCSCDNTVTTTMIHVRRQALPECPWCGERLKIYFL